jgi:hypothetical protein
MSRLEDGENCITRIRRRAGHVARIREERNVYRLLVEKPEGESPLGRLIRRWIDNVKMGLVISMR